MIAATMNFNDERVRRENTLFERRAYNLIKRLAAKNPTVHVNDFWDAVDRLKKKDANSPWHQDPMDLRILGRAFQKAKKDGIIRPAGYALRSNRFGSYYRPVWNSLIFNG